jgi:MoaA/NifB/PqqE/SkfB family radical SAM enzyme
VSDDLLAALYGAWDVTRNTTAQPPITDRCPFIDQGALAVGWDGGVSPCLPLLHSYTSYLQGIERCCRRWTLGNVNETPLLDLWRDAAHVAFRQRVQTFEFAPCTHCDGCALSEHNEDDCYGNTFPTCGGCLWAQGVVQCP